MKSSKEIYVSVHVSVELAEWGLFMSLHDVTQPSELPS